MTGTRIHRLALALAALALGVLVVGLGAGLVPARDEAMARGVLPQWRLTWGLIAIASLSAVTLAVFVVMNRRARS